MCKKLCIAVGAVIVGLLVISYTGVGSLIQVKYNDARSWMKRQVPLDDQVRQIHVEIKKIDSDIKHHADKIAVLAEEVDRLDDNVTAMKERQIRVREDILGMTRALDSNEAKVSYNKRTYRQAELTQRLETTVNTLEILKTEVKTKEQLLVQKRQSLDLAKQRIGEMRDQKEKLRVAVAKLETRIEMLKVKSVDCPIDIDDSQVSRVNGMYEEVERQVAQKEKKVEIYHELGINGAKETGKIVRETRSKDDVLQAAKKALQDDEEKVLFDKK